MLLPNGREAIYEPRYYGYGDFGGVDFYVEVAKATLGKKFTKDAEHETLRGWGITLCYIDDPQTREELAEKHPELAWWLLAKPKKRVRKPRFVEKRVPYSSVPDSEDCENQGY